MKFSQLKEQIHYNNRSKFFDIYKKVKEEDEQRANELMAYLHRPRILVFIDVNRLLYTGKSTYSLSFCQNCTMFEDDSILFAAKKTAALSGDIRKAFQICRAAAEQVLQNFEAEKENKHQAKKDFPKVRISDVQKASRESFNMALVTAVSFATSFQALLLISLASLRRSTGREVGGFDIKDKGVRCGDGR